MVINLYVITLWDKDPDTLNEEPYAYAIVAENIIKAEQIAIKQHLKEHEGASPDVSRDETLSFDITVALGDHGSLYDVLISRTR